MKTFSGLMARMIKVPGDIAKNNRQGVAVALEYAKKYFIPLIFIINFSLFYMITVGDDPNRDLKVISFTEFMETVNDGGVDSVSIDKYEYNRVIVFENDDGERFRTVYFTAENLEEISDAGVEIKEDFHAAKESDLAFVLMNAFLYTGLIVLIKFMMSGSATKDSDHDDLLLKKQNISFNDVKGVEEAKAEFAEIIDLFKNGDKYKREGINIPKGILLYGPPGTGKTLLAKAAAYESNATFIAATGSSFVQMFVGMGALRVRQTFKKARKSSPAIIFIDEIDALCGSRNSSGGNTEHSSTVNAILAEMDGFKINDNILVIGATNNPDSLDDAVKRPGRFDRHIYVGKPSVEGRVDLFKLYLDKLETDETVDLNRLAQSTTGLSGAQISYIANEAAILAMREDRTKVSQYDIEMARDRLLLGFENKSREILEQEKEVTAYHESGHALVAHLCCQNAYVDKISIIPRGAAAGHTLVLDKHDRLFVGKNELRNSIKALLAGRAAEEIVYGKGNVTTGASNDIERATAMASEYVKKYGFNNEIGLIYIPDAPNANPGIKSAQMVDRADMEVKDLISQSYHECLELITSHKDVLEILAQELIKAETLTKQQVIEILNQRKEEEKDEGIL